MNLQQASEAAGIGGDKEGKRKIEGEKYYVHQDDERGLYAVDVGEEQRSCHGEQNKYHNVEKHELCAPAENTAKPFKIPFQYRIEAEKHKIDKHHCFAGQQ